MNPTTFNIAFLVYVATCCSLSVLCVIFILIDDDHETVYTSIVTFILGKLTGMFIAKQAKADRKVIKALTSQESVTMPAVQVDE